MTVQHHPHSDNYTGPDPPAIGLDTMATKASSDEAHHIPDDSKPSKKPISVDRSLDGSHDIEDGHIIMTVDDQDDENTGGRLSSALRRWTRALGAEESGTERIPPSARTKQSPWSLFLVFFSANCCTATLALGYLGPTSYGLGWWDSFLCLVFFNLLGSVFPAAVAVAGHRTGLRTMAVPRFSFGWWPARVLAVLNVITQIGWGIVNDLSGSSILYDVAGGKLPSAVCALLIGLVALVVAALGYKYIHLYERYSWMVMCCCFAVLAGFGGRHFVNVPMGGSNATQAAETSSVLGFGTVIFGFQIAWVLIAADYSVYMDDMTPDAPVFTCAYLGLFLGQVLVEVLGAAVGTLLFNPDPRFAAAYDRAGMGGLMGAVFDGHGAGVRGFGKFVEALLSISSAAVIVCGLYSIGLSAQLVCRPALRVPRLVWSLLGGVVFLACAIAGRDHMSAVMSNFLNMCAYYITPLTTVLLADHLVMRRAKWASYDLDAWNDQSRLPLGIAASISAIVGTVVALMCMSQVWWVGPIALAIGGSEAGTDISWMLALGVTTVLYIPLRYWELRRFGR